MSRESGAAGIRTIPLRRCSSFGLYHRDPSGWAFRRPLALAVFRFFADRTILRPIVLSDGRSFWIAGASAPLATGHASPIFVLDSGRCSATCPLSGSQPGQGRPSRAIERLFDSASRRRSWGFALRSVVPARDSSRRFRLDIPTCRLVNQPPRSIFHRGTSFPGTDGPAHRSAQPLVYAHSKQEHLERLARAAALLRPSTAVADQGRSPRLLGFFATGNPCPSVKDRTGRDCLGLRLLQGFGSSLSLAARIEHVSKLIADSHKRFVRSCG